jgi:multiple antibiotic resistance protein
MDLGYFLFAFTSLFTLVDPIGGATVFVAFTNRFAREDIPRIAGRAALAATTILIIFAGLGDLIFSIYNLTIHAFRITGGVVFFRLGLNMLESLPSRTKSTPAEAEEAMTKDDLAITPLGIPLIAGPGAISSVMILAGQAETFIMRSHLFAAIILAVGFTYIIFRSADKILLRIGTTGTRVINRIMGLLLMVIAMQFFIDGIAGAVRDIILAP